MTRMIDKENRQLVTVRCPYCNRLAAQFVAPISMATRCSDRSEKEIQEVEQTIENMHIWTAIKEHTCDKYDSEPERTHHKKSLENASVRWAG